MALFRFFVDLQARSVDLLNFNPLLTLKPLKNQKQVESGQLYLGMTKSEDWLAFGNPKTHSAKFTDFLEDNLYFLQTTNQNFSDGLSFLASRGS